VDIVGEKRYSYINLFFSPFTFTENHPIVSMYLDHKIADEVSTYMKVLTYGPIVPSSYNYRMLFEDEMLFEEMLFEDDEQTYFSKSVNVTTLVNEIVDVPDKEPSETITFYPFIDSCSTNTTLQDIIGKHEVQHLSYEVFIAPVECQYPTCMSTYYTDLLIQPNNNKETVQRINGFRCPTSFYKEQGTMV
jgi:hypothetical protein